VDVTKCVEVTQGKKCGLCSKACEVLIDPRHPELGTHEMNECTRCRACVDSCPGQAITIPFLPRTKKLLERAPESKKER
jgi:ferredoxin-type protein NapH